MHLNDLDILRIAMRAKFDALLADPIFTVPRDAESDVKTQVDGMAGCLRDVMHDYLTHGLDYIADVRLEGEIAQANMTRGQTRNDAMRAMA